MSESQKVENKKQTMGFTTEGHKKLKDMSKRYGVNMWMMLDTMIETVDEQAPEFRKSIAEWQSIKGAKSAIAPEVAAALNEVTAGMSAEEVKQLLERAKQLQLT